MSLFKAPPFAALSYCWGELSDKVSITVNGLRFPVTANLHLALRRLRAERVERVWVDALCINQQDDEERSHQVRRMGTIFQKANQVAVWLGDAQDMTEEDIKTLSAEHTAIAYQVQPGSAQRAFLRLLLKPYWTRVWIIQELAAASKITIFCGCYKLSWETLERFSRPTFTAGIDGTDSDELKARFQNLLQFRIDRLSIKPVRLLEALYRSRYALSTDPKDKIYGLLGLTHDGDVFIPEPNYSQSVEETYTDFSKALIEKGFPLDLIYLRTSHRELYNSLPSWVVDWRDLNDALAKQEFKHIQASIQRSLLGSLPKQTDKPSFSENTLTLRGAILGTIDSMGSAFSANGNDVITHVVTTGKGAYSVPFDFDRSTYIFNALLETQRLSAATAELPPNPIGLWSSNDKTELKKFFLGPMKPNVLEVLSEWINANRSFITLGETMDFWDSIWTSQPIKIDQNTGRDKYLRFLVTTILSGMRIATIQTGELGWVHPQSQKGDRLCKVLGCDSYIILRSVAGGFQVIGEARLYWFAGEPELSDKVESLMIF